MKSRWMVLFSGLALVWSVSCGDDVNTETGTTASGGSASGGNGSGGSAAGPTTSTGGTTSNGGSGGAMGNDCEQACAKVDMCAGFPGACAAIGVDCNDAMAECPALCINAADCGALLSILGSTPDPTLSSCLDACDLGGGGSGGSGGGGSQVQCGICTFNSCQTQSTACQGVTACTDYVSCAANCSDSTCEQLCLGNNPSTESTNLSMCICNSCSAQCATCS
jgi:hypothetical protein